MLVTDRSVACREECYTQCMLRNVTLNKCESLLSPIFLIFPFVSVQSWPATVLSSLSLRHTLDCLGSFAQGAD